MTGDVLAITWGNRVFAVFMRGVGQRLAQRCGDLLNCKFVRCNAGAAAVEFALVAAPFLVLLIALFETVLVFFAGRVLDETTAQASRYILTGQAQQANMTQAGFAKYVCQNTFALFDCNKFMINVQNSNSFSTASTAAPTLNLNAQGQVTNQFTYSPGNAGDIVIVQVMYQWPVIGLLGFNLANIGANHVLLVSTTAFKNEPFTGGAAP
jgi:Flp pilus assembly protein TadG